jgi:hypothetical protein
VLDALIGIKIGGKKIENQREIWKSLAIKRNRKAEGVGQKGSGFFIFFGFWIYGLSNEEDGVEKILGLLVK